MFTTRRCALDKLSYCFYQYSTLVTALKYKKCYEILGIAEDSDQEKIRAAYLVLVKKYHPDSGTKEANVEKFYQIDEAFRLLIDKKSKERWNVEDTNDICEQDIKHTAPQHRQYLNYDGAGIGTPFQREKQYFKRRAIRASQNVFKHKMEQVTSQENALVKKTTVKHDIKTKYGIDRLVEDLIQESMAKGDFSKLSGFGKPLKEKHNRNPYVDLITHKLNEVLIDNGFTPEWISLLKEIRGDIAIFRGKLSQERTFFKPYPLPEDELENWFEKSKIYRNHVIDINTKIDKYNLIVPILDRQLFHINLDAEREKILRHGKDCSQIEAVRSKSEEENEAVHSGTPETFLGFIEKLFKTN